MRRILRSLSEPRDDRATMIGDAMGAVCLFLLTYAALHLPLIT
jgi:hypothetical protein